jgi:hypothetical protein
MKKGKNPIDQGELLRLEKAVTEAKRKYIESLLNYSRHPNNLRLLRLKHRIAMEELKIFREETEK